MELQAGREAETRSFPRLALDLESPPHELGQLAGYGEPEAGTAVLAGHRLVPLRELVEDAVPCLGGDADAGILHAHAHERRLLGEGQGQADPPLRGELHRVAEEVHHHLAQPPGVADEHPGEPRLQLQGKFQPFSRRVLGEDRHRVGGQLREVEGDVLELHAPGLDLGEVEDVVDDGEKRLARAAYRLHVAHLLLGETGAEEELGHAEHPVHRGPDLVAHLGQEVGLGAACRLGRLHGVADAFETLLELLVHAAQLARPLGHLQLKLLGMQRQPLVAHRDLGQHVVETGEEKA